MSDSKVVFLTKKVYASALYFLKIVIKSLKSISDESFNAICWSFLLFKVFTIKKCVVFSLTTFGTLKHDCVIKTRKKFNFFPLINNLITTGLSFLPVITSASVSSKTINTFRFFPRLYSSIF